MGERDLIREDCLKLLQCAYNDKVRECNEKVKERNTQQRTIERLKTELDSKGTPVLELINGYLLKDNAKLEEDNAKLKKDNAKLEEDKKNLNLVNTLLMDQLNEIVKIYQRQRDGREKNNNQENL